MCRRAVGFERVLIWNGDIMSYTFRVSDVDRGDYKCPVEEPVDALRRTLREVSREPMRRLTSARVAAREDYITVGVGAPIQGHYAHPFVAAATHAFSQHLPFSFSPDHVWALIAQGFAIHIAENPDLGVKLVGHAGKTTLRVRKDELIDPDRADAAWREGLGELVKQMEAHISKALVRSLCEDFSTTGEIERTVFRAVSMSAFQHHFQYELITLCGLPEVTIEGTPGDWEALYRRARALTKYGLDWWWEVLEPVLRELVNASKGMPDRDYWRSFVKEDSESGGPYWTGWIIYFFPYVKGAVGGGLTRNRYFDVDMTKMHDPTWMFSGLQVDMFPPPVSSTPLTWNFFGLTKQLELLAGFFGSTQLEDGTLRPELGYAIRYASSEKT